MDKFPMHRAAEKGDLESVRRLIEEGVSVDSQDDDLEWTPLHWAASKGRYEVAKLLVERGCDIDIKGRWLSNQNLKTTPLLLAAARKHPDVAALLIRNGADVNQKWSTGVTALYLAVSSDTQVLQALLESEKLDKNPQDQFGETPLHLACRLKYQVFTSQLLEAGADPNIKNIFGETVLSQHIKGGHATLEVIRLFLQYGAFLEDMDYEKIFQNPSLKENILKDVDLCTQSIVNKFHRQSLPTLYKSPYFARMLPSINNFKLDAVEIGEVENLVRAEIERNTFCDVLKVHPMSLSALCVLSLANYQP